MNDFDAGVGSFAAHCEVYGMVGGFKSAQAAYDNAEPDNTDVCEGCEDEDCGACDGECCDSCYSGDYEEDPDDQRDREYAYEDED